MRHSQSSGLTITNPLVLYRSLLATKQIVPDQGQHRLAIRLQALYESIKDYQPIPGYSQRLQELVREQSDDRRDASTKGPTAAPRPTWRSLLAQRKETDTLSLTRKISRAEATRNIDSPKGLMVHGEVGTGKSMLIDLFADCLPTEKKSRWHYNTFLLNVFSRLEEHRHMAQKASSKHQQDYSIASIAADIVKSSPILFLDEFQLPDRAASKIITSLMIAFFQLGGILVATSNRMPEELNKAAGVTFAQPPSRLDSIWWRLGISGNAIGKSENTLAGNGEFSEFLDILKSRCDVWEMPGKDDYRRRESRTTTPGLANLEFDMRVDATVDPCIENTAEKDDMLVGQTTSTTEMVMPVNYLLVSDSEDTQLAVTRLLATQSSWSPTRLRVYGRDLVLERTSGRIACCSFSELCENPLGPADYITVASAFDTVVLTEIPILTTLKKNEARRFITLLDALYEARCKLLVSAEVGPDDLFFPDVKQNGQAEPVHAETFSEAYQDVVAPFRPNASSEHANFKEDDRPNFDGARMRGMLAEDSLEDEPPNRRHRHLDEADESRRSTSAQVAAPNFAGTGTFTGEDERFAFKRARSRLWEMTGTKWWARNEPGWHRPVPDIARGWEKAAPPATDASAIKIVSTDHERGADGEVDAGMFRHGASPFRRSSEPPPKFNSTHFWSMMTWGKKAGAWGKGVEGLKDRKRDP